MDDTKTKILEATERLIIQHGWEKVTFRMITLEAAVNIAAINYHFGTRDALEDALLARFISPLTDKRYQSLKKAKEKAAPNPLDLESLIRCFLEPMLVFSKEFPNHFRLIQSFFYGIKNKNKIKEYFKGSVNKMNQEFVAALMNVLPNVSKEKILIQYVLLFQSAHVFLNNDIFSAITEPFGLTIKRDIFLEEIIQSLSSVFKMLEKEANIKNKKTTNKGEN